MRARFWLSFAALAVAIAILAPTLAPLSGSMDAFADDLANGTFRPFGPTGPQSSLGRFSGSLGGFTGQSDGNYLPGAAEVPDTWLMDRDGRGGNVVIDYVFDPALGAMKRLKAYDRVGPDGTTLSVADERLRPLQADPLLRYDRIIQGSFDVQFSPGEPIPIYSVHPKAVITAYRTDPPVQGGVSFFKDGADTVYAVAGTDRVVRLNLTYRTSSDYYAYRAPSGATAADYPASVRPVVDPELAADARVVLARAGVEDSRDVGAILDALTVYFRSFTEGDIPPPTEVESLYLALALGGHGCCRHRAFAFMVTAQAAGIPTRAVVNEAHAFAEVLLPNGRWVQINLGGCGTYDVNNPNDYPDLFDQAADPRGEANPDENRPVPVVRTVTNITESPTRIVKGETYYVNGTVETPDGRPVAGARIDVYLNETKDSVGRLTGAGTTDSTGRYSVVARVPRDLPARSYQLVARSAEATAGAVRYEESWSDPEVEVFTPTRFVLTRLTGAAGYPLQVTGRLVDIDSNPVAGAAVAWTADGVPRPDLRTDATGRFLGNVTFGTTGEKPFEFRYAGDAHHGSAIGNATARIETGAILLPPEAPLLVRGEVGAVAGVAAAAGVPLAGHEVRAYVLRGNSSLSVYGTGIVEGSATTGADGGFAIPMDVARALEPGVYPIRYEVPSLRLNASALVRIAARPTLDVSAPAGLGAGDGWILEARVRGDNGTSVAGAIVEVNVDGNATTMRALLTNRTGYARFELPAMPVGDRSVRVSFPGDEQHAPAVETLTVHVAEPWYRAIPPIAYAIAAAAVLLALLGAWLLLPGGPGRRLLASAIPGANSRGWRLRLAFPQHPAGVPPVFEPGERVHARVSARDRDGRSIDARVRLSWPSGLARGRTGAEGLLAETSAPETGPMRLEARASGLARLWTPPLVVLVPVHSYRQAVEEGFVALRERAALDPAASPGDLVRALEPRVGADARHRLRDVATLFEVADYSESAVDRSFYHAFATARLAVERDLEEKHA